MSAVSFNDFLIWLFPGVNQSPALTFAVSLVPAGALHACAAVTNWDHALAFAAAQVLLAVLNDAEKVVHATFTAACTATSVVFAYADCNAIARAEYAEETAVVYVVRALPSADSRAFTAAPTHAILAVIVKVVDVGIDVAANTIGATTTKLAAMTDTAKIFLFIILLFLIIFLNHRPFDFRFHYIK